MGKLIDIANLGVDLYQSKQLAAISASQNELHMSHMIEGMTSGMEVEKRKLIMTFESDFSGLDFTAKPNDSARSLTRIRTATNKLDITPSGFREFADMERAKEFNALLSQWENWVRGNVDSRVMETAELSNKYLFEDDDLKEYAVLQYVKEKEDIESTAIAKVLGGLFLAVMVGTLLAILIGLAIGDPYAENMISEEPDNEVKETDAFMGMFCGFSLVAIVPFFKWFKVNGEMVKMAYAPMKKGYEANDILKKGGGQEALDEHIITFGEMTSDDIIDERIRRMEFVVAHSD